jgi:putative DNA primase/helicase
MLEAGEATKPWRANADKDLGRYLAASAPRLWTSPPVNVMNLQNGLLDVESGSLLPHTPEHRSKVQLPITYDPEAECPNIDQFVRETFPEDASDLADELIALAMLPDMSIQKSVLLLGPGGNGKSIWLALMQAFLGAENYSTVPLHRLESDRFSAARLDGMLANICADLPASDLKGSSMGRSRSHNPLIRLTVLTVLADVSGW